MLMEGLVGLWFTVQADISQLETVAIEEEGQTQTVVENNRIKYELLCSYKRKEVRIFFHLRTRSCQRNMVRLAP